MRNKNFSAKQLRSGQDLASVEDSFVLERKPKVVRGFVISQTLMEILVGIGVMALISTSIAGLVYVSLTTVKLTREKSAAQTLINDMAASVKSVLHFDWHALWSSDGGAGYWGFDEGAGSGNDNSAVLDEISGSNGVVSLGSSGNTSLASAWLASANCKAGQCLSFDGVDDYVSVSDSLATSSVLDLTNALTFSVWVYPTSISGYNPIFAKIPVAATSGYEFLNSNGSLRLILRTPSAICDYSAGTLVADTWNYAAATYNGANITLYLNGSLVGTSPSCSSGAVTNNNILMIGGRASDNSRFAGRIDELRFYNRALSESEIANLYSGVNKFYPKNIGGIWQIKEGEETIEISNKKFTRSFSFLPVLRDGNNNIVSQNGNFDPLTKKVVYTVSWDNRSLVQEEYISRTIASEVFTQTDWSGGPGSTEVVFSAGRSFDTATSGIVYSVAGVLSAELAEAEGSTSTVDSVYRWAWSDIIGWIDFYGVSYDSGGSVFSGIASSSVGGISMNCLDTSCASSNYKVYSAASDSPDYSRGDLYGYAWNDIVGWFSFNCNQTGVGGANNCSSSNYKVQMNPSTGYFSGYAWNDIVGWISFNCSDLGVCGTSSYKVKMNLVSSSTSTKEVWLVSSVFDTQKEKGAVPVAIVWQGTLGGDTQVKFQVASSNAPNGPWNFIGADGTSSSYYPSTSASQPNIPVAINSKYHYNHRYFRYKVFLTSSASASPSVEDITILWKQ